MAFTSQLGTSNSYLGNLVLGIASGGGGGAGTADYQRWVVFGPPIPGAPWSARQYVEPHRFTPVPPPTPMIPAQTPYRRDVIFGPAIPGAPWTNRRYVEPHPFTPVPPPNPTIPGQTPYRRDYTFGPPIPGAPWSARRYVETHQYLVPPSGPNLPNVPTQRANTVQFLERVPDLKGPMAEDRLRRHTEKISNIVNSLIATRQLVQTGAASWEIFSAGIAALGLSGTFSSGTFSGGSPAPGSGKTGIFNSGSF